MAIKFNLYIDQGADHNTLFALDDENGTPINMTTYSGQGMMRKTFSSNVSYNMNVTANNANGIVSVSVNSNTSSSMQAGRYVYDISVHDSVTNAHSRIVEGIVTINPQVTK